MISTYFRVHPKLVKPHCGFRPKRTTPETICGIDWIPPHNSALFDVVSDEAS